jgi:EAL domain-containing protein (putative c-di-GMP-specific phosphodiesterase class I)
VPWWLAVAGLAAVVATGALAGPVAAGLAAVAVAAGLAALAQARQRATYPVATPAAAPAVTASPVVPPDTQPDTRPDAAAMPVPAPAPTAPAVPEPADLVLHFRPLRSLPELHLRGVEAELRWRQPAGELRAPADWPEAVAPAVATALLDAWLGPALAQFAAWLPLLRPRGGGTLWLRLPAPLLAWPDLPQRVAEALQAHALDPSVLVLRVPLRVQGRRAELPEAAAALQALGVTLAVDGFGAGTASLTHLDRLPVRTVCLAPSFVARAGPGTPQRWVVESTARLAKSLGMGTLAEGVAHDSQVLAMAALGCTLGVGEVCGPWLAAADWERRWSMGPAVRAA